MADPPPRASCSPLPWAPATSLASGHQVMWWRRGMNMPSPVSSESTPTKFTFPSRATDRREKPGSSAAQAVHQEAKKLTTVGLPRNSTRRTRPPPDRAGRSKRSGLVTPVPPGPLEVTRTVSVTRAARPRPSRPSRTLRCLPVTPPASPTPQAWPTPGGRGYRPPRPGSAGGAGPEPEAPGRPPVELGAPPPDLVHQPGPESLPGVEVAPGPAVGRDVRGRAPGGRRQPLVEAVELALVLLDPPGELRCPALEAGLGLDQAEPGVGRGRAPPAPGNDPDRGPFGPARAGDVDGHAQQVDDVHEGQGGPEAAATGVD